MFLTTQPSRGGFVRFTKKVSKKYFLKPSKPKDFTQVKKLWTSKIKKTKAAARRKTKVRKYNTTPLSNLIDSPSLDQNLEQSYDSNKLFVTQINTYGIKTHNTATTNASYLKWYPRLKFMWYYNKGLSPGKTGYLFMVTNGSLISNLMFDGEYPMAKAAGTFCKILFLNIENLYTFLITPTKSRRRVHLLSSFTYGRAHNIWQKKINYGIAMNPVDHPNGGRTNTKRPLKNPWGAPAKKNK